MSDPKEKASVVQTQAIETDEQYDAALDALAKGILRRLDTCPLYLGSTRRQHYQHASVTIPISAVVTEDDLVNAIADALRDMRVDLAALVITGETEPSKAPAMLIAALKPFADLGVGSGPDYETETYRITREAIRNARAAIQSATRTA